MRTRLTAMEEKHTVGLATLQQALTGIGAQVNNLNEKVLLFHSPPFLFALPSLQSSYHLN